MLPMSCGRRRTKEICKSGGKIPFHGVRLENMTFLSKSRKIIGRRMKYSIFICSKSRILVLTTRGLKQTGESWISLMVCKAEVESIWAAKALEPLKIVIGQGIAPFDEYRTDEHGRHHTINVIIMNRGSARIDGVKLYRTYVTEEAVLNAKVCLLGPISLAPGEKYPASVALYNESERVLAENRYITLSSPSNGMFNTTILLPAADRYSLFFEATSLDGPTATTNCRLWVDPFNMLRLEDINNLQ